MTRRFGSLRRIPALSVAITLVAAPIASAQSPEAAPPSAAPSNTMLLSPAAFARLVQPPADVAAVPVVKEPPRPSLLRQGTAAMARQPQAAPAKAPQRSWVARHKWVIIVPAIVAASLLILWNIPWDD